MSARKKTTTAKQPLGSAKELRQIDPIWLWGRVPSRYWEKPENGRKYLLWLAHRLGYRTKEGYYRLVQRDLVRHGGQGLLQGYGSSVPRMVKACFPEYPWCEWLFVRTPKRFWDAPENQRRYLEWLGKQLGFRGREDWYRLTQDNLLQHRGKGLLTKYGAIGQMIIACFPEYDWLPWRFDKAPKGFWNDATNRCRYLEWLGKTLGLRDREDWSCIRQRHLIEHRGNGLLARYRSRELIEEYLSKRSRKRG